MFVQGQGFIPPSPLQPPTVQDPSKIGDEINVQRLSPSAVRVWQRLAQENKVTIEQLMAILQLSRKLRILKSEPQTEEAQDRAGDYLVSSIFKPVNYYLVLSSPKM